MKTKTELSFSLKSEPKQLLAYQKRELKQLLAYYMDIDRDDCDSRDEYLEERKEACEDILAYCSKHNIHVDDRDIDTLQELAYSPNQLRFIEDALNHGLKVRYGYSGRGMYGDTCPAVHVEFYNDLETSANTRIDSLGLGFVIYAQH